MHRHQCKCQRSGQRNVLPGRGAGSVLACGFSGPCQQPAGAGASFRPVEKHIVQLRCCILLLYQAGELWAQDFEFICLTWVELRGFEPRTSCMPCKSGQWLGVAACGSTSSFRRSMPLVMACYRRPLAPRLAPQPVAGRRFAPRGTGLVGCYRPLLPGRAVRVPALRLQGAGLGRRPMSVVVITGWRLILYGADSSSQPWRP
jgi:hypothetical protein